MAAVVVVTKVTVTKVQVCLNPLYLTFSKNQNLMHFPNKALDLKPMCILTHLHAYIHTCIYAYTNKRYRLYIYIDFKSHPTGIAVR